LSVAASRLLLASLAGLLAAGPALAGEAPSASAPEDPREAKARAYFSDTVLLDQDGRERRFYTDVLKGNVVCMTFIFTNCGAACPLIMQKLHRVRKALGPRAAEVQFVSVSVDPYNDPPEAMRAFAQKHGATGPGWTFLTGRRDDVASVLKKLGTWVENPDEHTTAFVAGNARSYHWTKIRPDAPAEGAAEILRGLADEQPAAAPALAAPAAPAAPVTGVAATP
jgi:protein SCO1